MNKIIDSVTKVATRKAASATKQVLDSLEPEERLAVIGLGLIALSLIPEEKKGSAKRKGSKKPSSPP
jgi:hypothetical protein